MTMHHDDHFDPYRPEKQCGRKTAYAGARCFRRRVRWCLSAPRSRSTVRFEPVVAGLVRQRGATARQEPARAYDMNVADWEPTPPAIPEPVVLHTIREVHMPAMTMQAAPVPERRRLRQSQPLRSPCRRPASKGR